MPSSGPAQGTLAHQPEKNPNLTPPAIAFDVTARKTKRSPGMPIPRFEAQGIRRKDHGKLQIKTPTRASAITPSPSRERAGVRV